MTTMWLIPSNFWALPASTLASAGPVAIAVIDPMANVRTRRKDRDISCFPPKTPYPCARKRLWECKSAREKRKRRPGYGLERGHRIADQRARRDRVGESGPGRIGQWRNGDRAVR